MQPEVLAINHSKIIDSKLERLRELFAAMKTQMDAESKPILDRLLVDNTGVCVDCKENRVLIGKSVLVARKILKRNRPLIGQLYSEGTVQIETLANDYIQWLKS
jgi:hypothetical protein